MAQLEPGFALRGIARLLQCRELGPGRLGLSFAEREIDVGELAAVLLRGRERGAGGTHSAIERCQHPTGVCRALRGEPGARGTQPEIRGGGEIVAIGQPFELARRGCSIATLPQRFRAIDARR